MSRFYAAVEPSTNYGSIQDNQGLVAAELRRLEEKGLVSKCPSWAALVEWFGQVAVSKMAAVVKLRPDGAQKFRLIIDMLRSRVTEHVKLSERVVPPRPLDAAKDVVELMERRQGAAQTST